MAGKKPSDFTEADLIAAARELLQVEEDVDDGSLKTKREIAQALGVCRDTVNLIFERLEDAGATIVCVRLRKMGRDGVSRKVPCYGVKGA